MATTGNRSAAAAGRAAPAAPDEHGGGGGNGGGSGGGGGGNGGGGSDGSVTELIRQLTIIATAQQQLVQESRPITALNVDQLRLALHYGALRNGLGNFGRHGETVVALVAPQPTIDDFGTLEFAAPIQGAATVAIYRQDGSLLTRLPFAVSLHVDNDDAPSVRTVEIEDGQATPFLLGVVRHIASSGD
jgi:hypothetical protein